MDELEMHLQVELTAVTQALEDILGRRSRWNGLVELSKERFFRGKMRWDGSIALRADLAQDDIRWRTLIHEALHTFSIGLTPVVYENLKGWEEGVVEQVQRLLRPRLLHSLEVNAAESLFYAVETDHDYNLYIDALEELRLSLGQSGEAFYLHLLSIPLGERPNHIIRQGQQLSGDNYIRFRRAFAASFTRLRDKHDKPVQ